MSELYKQSLKDKPQAKNLRLGRVMKNPEGLTERRRYPRFSIKSPLEYWETEDSCCGGLVGNVSEKGLLIYSIHAIPIGTELKLKVFFSDGNELDGFEVLARTLWHSSLSTRAWRGYKCGLDSYTIQSESLSLAFMLQEVQ